MAILTLSISRPASAVACSAVVAVLKIRYPGRPYLLSKDDPYKTGEPFLRDIKELVGVSVDTVSSDVSAELYSTLCKSAPEGIQGSKISTELRCLIKSNPKKRLPKKHRNAGYSTLSAAVEAVTDQESPFRARTYGTPPNGRHELESTVIHSLASGLE